MLHAMQEASKASLCLDGRRTDRPNLLPLKSKFASLFLCMSLRLLPLLLLALFIIGIEGTVANRVVSVSSVSCPSVVMVGEGAEAEILNCAFKS